MFRIYQRIMEEQRKICGECQVTKRRKREQEKKVNKEQEKIEREKTERKKKRRRDQRSDAESTM